MGNNSETDVTARLKTTVLRRPMRAINSPVGTEKIKNQKNTIDGKRFARVSESAKSVFT